MFYSFHFSQSIYNNLLDIRDISKAKSIGVSIPIAELYRFPTLGQMARRISRHKEEHQASDTSVINWDSETSLTQDLISAAQCAYSRRPAKLHDRHEILLTRSTTFLGKTILHSLLHNPLVERVHCVAVPAEDASLFPSSNKISIYAGNLLTPSSWGDRCGRSVCCSIKGEQACRTIHAPLQRAERISRVELRHFRVCV